MSIHNQRDAVKTDPLPPLDVNQLVAEVLLSRMLDLRAAEISVIPIDHTTKRPAMALLPRNRDGKPTWAPYQERIADEDEIRRWVAAGVGAYAVVAGAISHGLEILDFDEPGFYERWCELVGSDADGLPVQRTGGGGYQVFWRCEAISGNQKLAWVPDESELTGRRIAIETRGEGGYAVVAPSLHPSGNRYEWLSGSLETVPTIPPSRRESLLAAARLLDQAPKSRQQIENEARPAVRVGLNGHNSVIDAFNGRYSIEEVLERNGYRPAGGGRYIRPEGEHSSVTVRDGRSFHHNTNDPLTDGYWHDAFDVFSQLEHSGDYRAAVRAAAGELGLQSDDRRNGHTPSDDKESCDDDEPLMTLDEILSELALLQPNDENGPDRRAVEAKARGLIKPARGLTGAECLEVANALEALGARASFIREWQIAVREERRAYRQHAAEREGGQKRPTTEEYIKALAELGYDFRLNECNDDIEVNGVPITDALRAKIRAQMRDRGFIYVNVMEDAYVAHAYDNRYHPIRQYLRGLEWDGQDWINRLSGYFSDAHQPILYEDGSTKSVFRAWLTRWLLGAVAKVEEGAQNVMLVLDGPQDIGKSHWVRWLCPLQDYFIEGPINPDDKDSFVRLIGKWIWEVAELGATTRKADREALKHFITTEWVTVRKAYGRHDMNKRAMASLVGTINNEAGFLNDPTGNRRFLTCTLTAIDWSYATEIDVHQLWAQAYALYKRGEPWRLSPEEKRAQRAINSGYEVENTIEWYLRRVCIVDPQRENWWTPAGEIVNRILAMGYRGTTRQVEMELAVAAQRLGLKKVKRQVSGYRGVTLRLEPEPGGWS